MAFVSSSTFAPTDGAGSIPFSLTAAAGDVLVAVLITDDIKRESGAISTADVSMPSGWTVHWVDGAAPTGLPSRRRAVVAVASLPVTVAGTISGTVTWPLYRAYAVLKTLLVLRFSGIRQVIGWSATALNNQSATFPAVAGASMSGDVVRVACVQGYVTPSTLVPAGHTLHGSARTGWAGTYLVEGWGVVSSAPVTSSTVTAATTTGNRVSGWGLSLALSSTVGPGAPTITAPVSGPVDLTVAHTVSWTPDGVQSAYSVARRAGGGSWSWWDGSGFTGASESWITGAGTSITAPAIAGGGGAAYEYQVRTKGDSDHPDGSAPAVVSVSSWPAPTTSSVVLSPLSGSTVTSRLPVITVTGSAGAGAGLSGWEAEVFDATTGEVYARNRWAWIPSWTVTMDQALPNNTAVKVRGRAIQNQTQTSAWVTSSTYTVSVPTPPAPTVTATEVTHPVSGLPGVRLTITTTGGVVARIVRDGTLLGDWPSPGVVQWEDYTLAPGVATSYAVSTLDAASPRNESPQTTVTVTLSATGEHAHCWLIDLYDPATAVQVHLVGADDDVMDLRTTVYEPLGRADRIARSMTASTLSGRYTVSADDPATVAGALALLSSGRTLVYRAAVEMHLRTNAQYPGINRPIRPVGQVAISRPAEGPWTLRHLTFSWIEQ